MRSLQDLQPVKVWQYLQELLDLQRGSGNEQEVAKWLMNQAILHHWRFQQDEAGNVYIWVPGKTDYPGVIEQCHMDIVGKQEKTIAVVDGEWVRSDGTTTLGIDNSGGIALALALAEELNGQNPPLLLIFTVREETDQFGAANINASLIDLATYKYLINLDSEDFGEIYISSAGAIMGEIIIQLRPTALVQLSPFIRLAEIAITGFQGGHSGCQIHEAKRQNAILTAVKAMHSIGDRGFEGMVSIDGGGAKNAIPQDCQIRMIISTPGFHETEIQDTLNRLPELATEQQGQIKINLEHPADKQRIWQADDQRGILELLLILPNGVIDWDPEIPGLVQTSNNIGTIKTEGDIVTIGFMCRSSDEEMLDLTLTSIQEIVAESDLQAEIKTEMRLPAWPPRPDTELERMVREAYRTIGVETKTKGIHAGLETSLFAIKFPSLQFVSIGPTIESPHSKKERVNIKSVYDFYQMMKNLLSR